MTSLQGKLFNCNNLEVGYQRPLGNKLSFSLEEGKIAFVKGSNGSGKTTFIKTILGQLKKISGDFQWDVREDAISYLPQITNSVSQFSYSISEILDIYEVEEQYISKLPDSLLNKRWIDTSGGEKQKVMLITRLSSKTKVLILDEPFNHLDKESIEILRSTLFDLIQGRDPIGIILVSHIEVDFPEEYLTKVKLI